MSVSHVCVCAITETLWTGDFWLKTVWVICGASIILCVLKVFRIFGSLQTSLLCIMGELVGGGSVTVAVGVSNRWQVALATRHVTLDM